jgi:hypothetical protein
VHTCACFRCDFFLAATSSAAKALPNDCCVWIKRWEYTIVLLPHVSINLVLKVSALSWNVLRGVLGTLRFCNVRTTRWWWWRREATEIVRLIVRTVSICGGRGTDGDLKNYILHWGATRRNPNEWSWWTQLNCDLTNDAQDLSIRQGSFYAFRSVLFASLIHIESGGYD